MCISEVFQIVGAVPFYFQRQGDRKRFAYKFKFSVEFPIGLHVILQLQIKKSKLPTILSAKLF